MYFRHIRLPIHFLVIFPLSIHFSMHYDCLLFSAAREYFMRDRKKNQLFGMYLLIWFEQCPSNKVLRWGFQFLVSTL